MNTKRFIAFGLAAAMFVGTAGMTVYASEALCLEEISDDEEFFEVSNSYAASGSCDDVLEDRFSDSEFTDSEIGGTLTDEGISGEFGDDLIEDAFAGNEMDDFFDDDAFGFNDEDNLFTTGEEADQDADLEDDPDGFMEDLDDGTQIDEMDLDAEDDDAEASKDSDDLFDEDDDDIILMAAKSPTEKIPDTFVKESKKTAQTVINSVIDLFAKDKEMAMLVPLMKLLVGEMLDLNGSVDPNQEILNKLDEIDRHLDQMEERLNEHLENVVSFDSIGGEFQNVADTITPLKCKIGDAVNQYKKGKISEEELNETLAALYNRGEYTDLMRALSGATNSFNGNTSYTLDQRSIFGAAYNLQCNSVMFSGEAVDCVTPYLLRQLCTYIKGYALINTVLDAYEEIHGADSTVTTRNEMFKALGGIVNGKFDEKRPGVFGLYIKFFDTYRCTFVNKSSNPANHVKLSKDIYGVFHFSENYLGTGGPVQKNKVMEYTPTAMSNFPLNEGQMNALAQYAASKGTTLYDLLFNIVGFDLKISPTMTLMRYFGMNYGSCTADSTIQVPEAIGCGQFTTRAVSLRECIEKGQTYIPAGNQYITFEDEKCNGFCQAPAYNYIKAINATKAGAGNEKLCLAYNYDKNRTGRAKNPNMLFFIRG